MNEEKPFLGFSSFRAEPERKLSRRLVVSGYFKQDTTATAAFPPATSGYTNRERHRILYVQKPGRKIIESLQMALHPERYRQERLVRRGRQRSQQRLKGGERSSPAGVFLRRRPGSTARPDIRCPAIIVMRHAFLARRKQITRSSRAQSRFCKAIANYS